MIVCDVFTWVPAYAGIHAELLYIHKNIPVFELIRSPESIKSEKNNNKKSSTKLSIGSSKVAYWYQYTHHQLRIHDEGHNTLHVIEKKEKQICVVGCKFNWE